MEIFFIDWREMFFGDSDWQITFEIIFRTIFLYLFTLLITRFVGRRRSLSKLTPLELILIVVLGPAVGGGMVAEVPLVHSMIVITTAAIFAKFGATLARQSEWVHNFLGGKPLLLIKNGVILKEQLKKENITEEDVKRELRESGYKSEKEIAEGYLEPSGKTSFFEKEK